MELSTKEQINLEIQVRQNVKLSRNRRQELKEVFERWLNPEHENGNCKTGPSQNSCPDNGADDGWTPLDKNKQSNNGDALNRRNHDGNIAKQTIMKCLWNASNNNGSFIWTDFPLDLVNYSKSAFVSIEFCMDGANFGAQHMIACPSSVDSVEFVYHFYKLHDDVSQNGFEEDLPATFHTVLPSRNYDALWESLIFDSDIKAKLMNYVRTSLMFAKHNINQSIITWNKMILLHGPPGTGKTSLCKALAQKFAIRSGSDYRDFQLIEINAHSLFSKWFSESGKLVLKLFDGIREFAEDPQHLVFVLIDEVESLAYDRQRVNSADPTDAMRVVNALLTQIDSIKRYPNVIILASSNVTEAMDDAFVDRVDIKQFIGLPSICAVYRILAHCIFELLNNDIVVGTQHSASAPNSNTVRIKCRPLLSYPRAVHHELIIDNDFTSDCLTGTVHEPVSGGSPSTTSFVPLNGAVADGKSARIRSIATNSSSSEAAASASDSSSHSSLESSQFVLVGGGGAGRCEEEVDSQTVEYSVRLLRLSRRCVSLSGRTLRKLPFLAIALFSAREVGDSLTLAEFFVSLERAIDKQLQDNKHFKN